MSLSVIRPFTAEDKERLNASALRFADRHGIQLDLDGLGLAQALDMHISWVESQLPPLLLLPQLWQACRCRALRVNVAADIDVGYGYIGHSVS